MTYELNTHDHVLISWPSRPLCFRDGDHKPELDAQVASDDYFALLATQLDSISQSLKRTNHSDYLPIEAIIDNLLYLHKYYRVRKR